MPRSRHARRLGLLTALGLAAAPLTVLPATADVSPTAQVVINEVYGGGGNAGSTFTNDFIELINKGTTDVDVSGWSVQYKSSTGAAGNWQVTDLVGTIPAGSSYLVQEAAGTGGTLPLPSPDVVGTIPMAAGSGVVALSDTQEVVNCTGAACSTTASVLDVVGYGSADTFAGSATAPTASAANSVARDALATNTADNEADFTAGPPTPRGSFVPSTVVPTCPDSVTTEQGTATEAEMTATDPGATVDSAEIISDVPSTITLDFTPAPADGGTLEATLSVSDTTEAGVYDVEVEFANDDDPPQTATCTVTVQVNPEGTSLISDVQGDGETSPLAGLDVTVEGIVTSVLTGDDEGDQLGGFFMEEEPTDRDGDPQTSEGIFVFAGAQSDTLALEVGEIVEVTGDAGERFGQTQITATEPVIETAPATVGAPLLLLVPPVVVDELPTSTADRAAEFEPVESMRVQLGGEWVVTEPFSLHNFGEVTILPGTQPLRNPTNTGEPGPEAGATEDQIGAGLLSLILDDSRDGQLSPDAFSAPYVSDDGTGTLRRGSTLTDQVAVMSYGFDVYRLRPVTTEDSVEFDYAPRPEVPETGGDVRVASFNVLNYFNGDGAGGGFPTSRGAATFEEFERQSAKIEAALVEIDADVVGLIEIENDDTVPGGAVADLVERLNEALAAAGSTRTYDYVDTGTVGTDEIKNAFIYDPATVSLGGFAVLDDVDPFNRNTRPPIAARFVETATGEEFVPIVNHFKSKGSGDGANADQGDGQGASNPDRVLAAQELVSWTETDAFFAADDRLLVMGDINAYANEDPIDVFVGDNGYTDLLEAFSDEGDGAYTYTFFGAEGRLDHALASASALESVVDADTWAINADEPRGKDYTSFNQPELYQADAYRSSDHDPVIVGLVLAAEVVDPPVEPPPGGGDPDPGPAPGPGAGDDDGTGGTDGSRLPRTGTEIVGLVGLAIVLLAGGATAVVMTRRRILGGHAE